MDRSIRLDPRRALGAALLVVASLGLACSAQAPMGSGDEASEAPVGVEDPGLAGEAPDRPAPTPQPAPSEPPLDYATGNGGGTHVGEEFPDSAEPAAEPSSKPSPLHWNAWPAPLPNARPETPPAHPLERGDDYRIYVDLSRLAYAFEGVATSPSGEGMSELAAAAEAREARKVILKAIVLPNPTTYQLTRGQEQAFEIDLSTGSSAVPADATFADYLGTRLGGFDFDVHVADESGPAEITLSIWLEERPIDEVVLRFCIRSASQCAPDAAVHLTSPRILFPSGTRPDVALHLIEVERGAGRALKGVLRLADREDSLTWELPYGVEVLRRQLSPLVDAIGAAIVYPDAEMLREHGAALFRQLFPGPEQPDTPSRAELAGAELTRFLVAATQRGAPRPRVLVRAIAIDSTEPLFLPFGVMAIASGEGEAADAANGSQPAASEEAQPTGQGVSEPLGLLTAVEIPLPSLTAADPLLCAKNWYLAAPPENFSDPALRAAVGAMDAMRPAAVRRFTTLKSFLGLLNETKGSPGVYIALSHHDRDRLRFDTSDTFAPGNLRRRPFAHSSVAILDGCETAGVGSTGFLKKFDELDLTAVVATTATIPGDLAGRYLRCLATHTGDGVTLADAHEAAIRCLRGESQDPRVALFQLFGDTTVRLCPERMPEPDDEGWINPEGGEDHG